MTEKSGAQSRVFAGSGRATSISVAHQRPQASRRSSSLSSVSVSGEPDHRHQHAPSPEYGQAKAPGPHGEPQHDWVAAPLGQLAVQTIRTQPHALGRVALGSQRSPQLRVIDKTCRQPQPRAERADPDADPQQRHRGDHRADDQRDDDRDGDDELEHGLEGSKDGVTNAIYARAPSGVIVPPRDREGLRSP